MHLLLTQYLKESFHSTAYAINVYVQPGTHALRLTHYSREQIEGGQGPRIKMAFARKVKQVGSKTRRGSQVTSASKRKRIGDEDEDEDEENEPVMGKGKRKRKKVKTTTQATSASKRKRIEDEDEDEDEENEPVMGKGKGKRKKVKTTTYESDRMSDFGSDEDDIEDFIVPDDDVQVSKSGRKPSGSGKSDWLVKDKPLKEVEHIELSSDDGDGWEFRLNPTIGSSKPKLVNGTNGKEDGDVIVLSD